MRARAGTGCAVCGSLEVSRDEVLDGAALGLAACERCGHLWTERPLVRALRDRRLAASTGTAVVLFSAPHCGACRAWKRLLPDALAGVADSFHEVDVSEATGVARGFDIFHLPTIYLYRDGQSMPNYNARRGPTPSGTPR